MNTMIDEKAMPALEALKALNIEYKYYSHAAAKTMEDCAHIGEDVGARHFKNLFLTNRQCTDFYLLLIGESKPFRTADVSKQLGVSRLSFATPEYMQKKLNLAPGAVTPLALINNAQHDIIVVIDSDILHYGMVCAHPLISSASVALKMDDLLRFIAACGNPVRYVDIGGNP